MLAALIIVFREVIEAGLVVGIVLTATDGVPKSRLWISGGVLSGIVGACLIAAFAQTLADAFSGVGQELFNATILSVAVLMLIWHNVWMARHSRDISARMKNVGRDVVAGRQPLTALATVVGVAVLREGSEIVLFLYGIAISGRNIAAMIGGTAAGIALGAAVSALMYLGLLRIPTRHLFRVTGGLIALLAAGMASQAASFLQQGQVVNFLDRIVWNTSALVSDGSIAGEVLHTLVGYTAQPTGLQLVFYVSTLFLIFALMRLFGNQPDGKEKKVASAAVLGGVALVLLFGGTRRAFALDEIYEPNTEYHEVSVEYNGSHTFDGHAGRNNAQANEFVIEAGVLPRLTLEASGIMEKTPGQAAECTATEIEGRVQFFEQGAQWLDSGLLAAYDFAAHRTGADSLEVKLLLQKDVDLFTHTANIGFSQDVGAHASGGPDYVFLWNSRYRYNEYVQPGLEIQSDFGQGLALRHYKLQEHYLGPALYGRLSNRVKYQVAYLAGISNAAARGAARISLEYEMHF